MTSGPRGSRVPSARRRAVAAGLGLAALVAVAVAGCGGGSGTPTRTVGSSASVPSPSGTKNQVDLAFADTMIPHAVQTLAATQIAGQKATQPKIKELATAIGGAAQPQIETLSAWLVSWGQPVPGGAQTTEGGAAISTRDLEKLGQAQGAAFDQYWLQAMIRHQQVALAIAQQEIKRGTNPGIKAMAQKMLDERKTQITTMQGLLTKK